MLKLLLLSVLLYALLAQMVAALAAPLTLPRKAPSDSVSGTIKLPKISGPQLGPFSMGLQLVKRPTTEEKQSLSQAIKNEGFGVKFQMHLD